MGVLLLGNFKLSLQELDTIVSFLIGAAYHPYKLALVAPKDDGRALILVREELFIGDHLLATFVEMTTPEKNFAQEVPCHSVHPIELTLVSAKWTGVWVLIEPVCFAVAT